MSETFDDNGPLFRGRILNTGWDVYDQNTYVCEGELGSPNDTIIRPYQQTYAVYMRSAKGIIHSGAYARARLGFCAFNHSENKGIAFGLQNLQKVNVPCH